jgi:hypothetical protein
VRRHTMIPENLVVTRNFKEMAEKKKKHQLLMQLR